MLYNTVGCVMKKILILFLSISFSQILVLSIKAENLNRIDDSELNTSTGTKWIITGMEPMNETYEIGVKTTF